MTSLTTTTRPVRHALRSTGVLALSLVLTVGVLVLLSSFVDSGA